MKAAIVTYGCKVNQHESDALTLMLTEAGYEIGSPQESDLVVINTCTVTDRADIEALKTIRRLKRQNPKALVVGTGCLAQSDPSRLDQADLVLGQMEKARLTDYLALPKGTVLVSRESQTISDFGAPKPSRTRAFHKIQDGCNARCAYCAVPNARGPSRSLSSQRVLDSLSEYLAAGLKEIVLTGIHLGRWGYDLTPKENLSSLLSQIDSTLASPLKRARLRLSSLEPPEIPLVVNALKTLPWLAPHLHTPLQSGSDHVLKAMGRPYQIDKLKSLLSKLKSDLPDLNLGTDLMVGFPGERPEDFEATVDLVKKLDFGYLHVFPFSPRPNTPAMLMEDSVPYEAKKERVALLRRLGAQKKAAFLASQLEKRRPALVENTLYMGRLKVLTDNYLPALLPLGAKASPGEIVEVTLYAPKEAKAIAEARL
ncbi:MAG: tRNA (N(6)-L-threonylcarbamoyladenosine(37)-C(2))-methylthiotransferase MtaB [Deltaproteobacteria bacterium]|nr:tRNA (N(6)-L-threonylcarbamoyladenosine(37)-C(2))-methylthiotransferase MtaB [Deltaproteobacteria bacterium]